MKIYTRTGDTGTTALYGGMRVAKHHSRIEAYGTIDELNSYLGLVASLLENSPQVAVLSNIQQELFVLGSHLAVQPNKPGLKLPELKAETVEILENEIDRMDAELAPLKFFILPGGSALVSQIHIARCISRRAERACTLVQESEQVNPLIVQILNRLSDYLFTLARHAGAQNGVAEIPWISR